MNRMLLGYNPDFDLFEEESAAARPLKHAASVLDADRSEAATELLEATGQSTPSSLPNLLAQWLRRAAHAASGRRLNAAVEGELVRLLHRAARGALPHSTTRLVSGDGAARASRFFGIELEGLSPEDQEFEAARRFIQLVEAAAGHASAASPRVPPAVAAWLAATLAAKRFAPGWLAAHRTPPGAAGPGHRSAGITAGGLRPVSFQGAHHA
jgi:hypothetical protein